MSFGGRFSLSFKKGTPVAIIREGSEDGKLIRIYDNEEDDKKKICCDKCSSKCIKKKKKCCGDCKAQSGGCMACGGCGTCGGGCLECGGESDDIKVKDPFDYISEDMIKKGKGKFNVLDIAKLKRALLLEKKPKEERLHDPYDSTAGVLKNKVRMEYNIHDGKIVPYPNTNPKNSDRMYIAGPSGSGKSRYIKNYMLEFIKLHPDRMIYIFSHKKHDENFEDEPRLEGTYIRVILDKKLIKRPIQVEELKNSLVIFDDVDSIPDKKIKENVMTLRDQLLKIGRSQGIDVISTAHLMTNYKETREILADCPLITFFPGSGSGYGIKYLLTKYAGLDKENREKIMKLPSRWVTINISCPNYVLYEKGIYLLN
jgi:hypothetical protein